MRSPNILLIMTDQFRPDCIAALGNPVIKTPNLDRLVRGGTAFTQCTTPSPVCVPARHSLASGVAPHVSGCFDNVSAKRLDESLMDRLAAAGYQTHGTGKMHFSKQCGDWGFQSRDTSEETGLTDENDDYKRFLTEQGYGHVIDPHGLRSELYYVPQPSQLPAHLHNSHWVADRSIEFLRGRDRSRPFFLWSSFIKPHPPFESPNPWGRLYRMHEMEPPFLPDGYGENWTFWNRVQNRYKYVEGFAESRNISRTIKAAYYGTISFIDYNIGRMLDALGSEADDTLIVFTSDHGELLGDFGCYGKRSMLDPSVRVPLLAHYPRAFPRNHRCGHPASLLDLFPTFTALAGTGESPDDREGVPLTKVLTDDGRDRIVFSQFSTNSLGLYMAADANWKYIHSAADNRDWLFDLRKDPRETRSRHADPACRTELARLKHACIARFKRDAFPGPLDGDDWRRFEPLPPPAPGSDDGLLFQDPPQLDDAVHSLPGFGRSTRFKQQEKFQLLERLVEYAAADHCPRDGSSRAGCGHP